MRRADELKLQSMTQDIIGKKLNYRYQKLFEDNYKKLTI